MNVVEAFLFIQNQTGSSQAPNKEKLRELPARAAKKQDQQVEPPPLTAPATSKDLEQDSIIPPSIAFQQVVYTRQL